MGGWIVAGVALFLLVACLAAYYRFFLNGNKASASAADYDVDIGRIEVASAAPGVPKIIWAFWEGKMPPFVCRCFQEFRERNSDYLMVVMNRRNVKQYTAVDLSKFPRTNDSIQRFTDAVRLHVLAEYGGFWLDASIILQTSLNVFSAKITGANAEFFGFTIGSVHDTPGDYRQAPVVENWFLACTKSSAFMRAWRDEFMRLNRFESVRAYVASVKAEGVDLSRMNRKLIHYLASHVSARRVMSLGPEAFRLYLERSEDGPFKFEFDHGWSHGKALRAVAAGKYRDMPLIKLNGAARKRAQWWSNPNVFFH